jgi:flavin-dependent dehydrogenase
MPHHDICILGAGPGGATAALHLANAGQRCLLLDRAAFPRDKTCGDALSGKVINELKRIEPGLHAKLAAAPIQIPSWGIDFIAPNGRKLSIPFKPKFDKAHDPTAGHVAKRIDFDNFLVEEVRQRPEIDFRENVDVARTERTPTGWQLLDKAGQEIVSCRLLLVANGAQSEFARKVAGHALEPDHHCAGLRTYYDGVAGLSPDNFIELHFIKDFLPGYLWVFPLPNGQANVGVGMLSKTVADKKVNLRQRLDEILTTHPALAPRFAGATRLGSVIDPFSGEGISHAMVSGRHAAIWATEAVKKDDFSPEFLKSYDKAVYNRLGQELRLSRVMQRLLNFPSLFNIVANRAVSNPTLAATLSMMFMDLDLREQLRKPSFYFKLFFGGK